ncbi:cuticle protein AMP4-like [Oratosquilla oratoria]|uniref:cuticle protein AMP4-like n=1 Tax=Oratosquilla oratoria TaxID=337810 RepID=UPI003F76F04F
MKFKIYMTVFRNITPNLPKYVAISKYKTCFLYSILTPVIFAALLAIVIADTVPVHIPIVAETRQEPVDGASASDFESGNGIRFTQKAVAGGAGQSNAEGIFSYPDEHGNVIEVRYVANENGFQPLGDHLPVGPPAPPHVAELLRIAEEQRAAGITFE